MAKPDKGTGHPADDAETILVVEDGAAVRKAVEFILQKSGYRVLNASGSLEALEILRRHGGPVHLLLTDVMMPELSGPDLAVRMGKDRPEMKVLYVSGHSDRNAVTQEVIARGEPFLRKPFAMDELLAKVRSVLDGEDPPVRHPED